MKIQPSEITPETTFQQRRQLIKGAAATLGSLVTTTSLAYTPKPNPQYQLSDEITPEEKATTFNNFYELGTGKSEPAQYAQYLKTDPWTLHVDGLVNNPMTLGLEDMEKTFPLEERIYRFRCVEGWSMVVPWDGFPLANLLKKAEPKPEAQFVRFESIYDPKNLSMQRTSILPWPYVEGLRLDEAMHPLTLLATGLYGKPLPKQNGAPIRLVIPWKYGFKNIKSIVRITLVNKPFASTWMQVNPQEYGFYANVNPQVPHPRWSQATERRLGHFFKQDTLLFNGYEQQVASLYKDQMNERIFF